MNTRLRFICEDDEQLWYISDPVVLKRFGIDSQPQADAGYLPANLRARDRLSDVCHGNHCRPAEYPP
jgi:hypothetical protein